MVDVDKSVIARYKKQGKNFEVAVDCTAALELREGKDKPMDEVLASDKIFADSKKGLVASEHELKAIFETDDHEQIAKKIIMDGELQLTAEYKAAMREKKRKQIIDFIRRNGIDPKTSLPHPQQRIELAFEEGKIKIDEKKPVQKQIEEIIKKLKTILPISFAKKEVALKFPASYAGKGQSSVRAMAVLKREEWGADGSWFAVVEIPAGLQNELFDKVNSISHGEAEIKILKVSE
ncbi:ribosome assembly factor SBDS [Candidatus Woesearchaeota archaeon]|nr:ribosome assembly factor SBDS [Candidatus Woesearchaeota archaeon]